MSAILARSISLPQVDESPQRPTFSNGPRGIESVSLLRISVTDRCNLRCVYCMPDGGIDFHDQQDLLAPAEFETVARVAMKLGITHLKITGGEPTIRKDILDIAQRLAALKPDDLSLTTNGTQLHRLAHPLRDAGVGRLTLSLDSLQAGRYRNITGGGSIEQFWRGVDAAQDAGFRRLKMNVVVIRGFNDDEAADFAALTIDKPWTVRFIEYMPLGHSRLSAPGVDADASIIDNEEIRQSIEAVHGPLQGLDRSTEIGVGPANVFQMPHAEGRIGFISAMSRPFCETCNRLRLTAMGELRSCLFDAGEVSVLPAIRPRVSETQLADMFRSSVMLKPDVHSFRGNRAMSQIGG